MEKELFVVRNSQGAVIRGNFPSKPAAKTARDILQAETSRGIPKPEDKLHHTNWDFYVSYGKDHRHFLPPVSNHL